MSATRPRAMFTTSAPSGSAARNSRSTSPVVASLSGTPTITISAAGSSCGQFVDAVDAPGGVIAGVARDPGEVDLERREPLLDRPAHPAVAEEQHAAIGEALVAGGRPSPVARGAHEVGDPALRGEHEREGQLRGRRLVHARRVREDVPGRQRVGHVVVSDRLRLHEPDVDALQRAEAVGRTHVRRHDEVDARSGLDGRRAGEVPFAKLDPVGHAAGRLLERAAQRRAGHGHEEGTA